MRVLITFALESEFAPWRAMHMFRSDKWGTAEVQVTEIGAAEVGVVLTGVGPAHGMRRAADVLRTGASVDACISSGVAGALKDSYQIGQVLAARSLSSETRRTQGDAQALDCSAALVSFAGDCGATVVDRFYTAGRVIERAEDKRRLGKSADAVEMESFEILREAREAGAPGVAIRGISDLANEDLPLDMSRILTDDGRVSMTRVLSEATLHPGSLPGLMKLGKQSKQAAEALASFLDKYVAMIAGRMGNLEAKAEAAT